MTAVTLSSWKRLGSKPISEPYFKKDQEPHLTSTALSIISKTTKSDALEKPNDFSSASLLSTTYVYVNFFPSSILFTKSVHRKVPMNLVARFNQFITRRLVNILAVDRIHPAAAGLDIIFLQSVNGTDVNGRTAGIGDF